MKQRKTRGWRKPPSFLLPLITLHRAVITPQGNSKTPYITRLYMDHYPYYPYYPFFRLRGSQGARGASEGLLSTKKGHFRPPLFFFQGNKGNTGKL
jgi:hypothetical protein